MKNNKISFLQSFFKLKENNTSIKTEVLAGVTTFVTIAYILLVIPNILKFSGMNSMGILGEGANSLTTLNDPVVASIFTSMCLICAIGTMIMGLYANLPFAVGPGIGLTAFFTYSVCLTLGYSWQQALSAIFLSGLLFIIITVTSIREKIVDALPENLKTAITCGIGLFITLIGLKNGGIIVAHPSTLVGFGSFTNPHVVLTLIGILSMIFLMAKKIPGAMLLSIIFTTIIGIPMGITNIKDAHILSLPSSISPTFMAFDFKGLLNHHGSGVLGALISIIMVVLTFSLVDLFDAIGTLVGTAEKANMILPNGKIKNIKKALLTDAIATTISAMLGTTTTATYIESAAGISEGGKTGLTSVVIGILFILSLFLGGLVGIVPSEATSPVLIIVGCLMISSIKKINFEDFTETIPAFFTICIMPFSYSIANGIAVGIIFYPIMKLITKRYKEVNPIMYILSVLFIIRFVMI